LIEDAVISIRRANAAAFRRRQELLAVRLPMQLLDYWLSEVETLVERDEAVVPESLMAQIGRFLGKRDPRLYRRLRRSGKLDAMHVLDALFEAEEQFLPQVADTG
jgi:hypothetical protein